MAGIGFCWTIQVPGVLLWADRCLYRKLKFRWLVSRFLTSSRKSLGNMLKEVTMPLQDRRGQGFQDGVFMRVSLYNRELTMEAPCYRPRGGQ